MSESLYVKISYFLSPRLCKFRIPFCCLKWTLPDSLAGVKKAKHRSSYVPLRHQIRSQLKVSHQLIKFINMVSFVNNLW